jgi:hypothetical protein
MERSAFADFRTRPGVVEVEIFRVELSGGGAMLWP